MELEHEYLVEASCTAPKSGVVSAPAILPSLSFSAPPEFQGGPGVWTPEHFLVAAVASCFVSTFSNMAQMSRLEYASFELRAKGVISRAEGPWRFTEIKLSPRVTLHKEEQRNLALRLLEKADKSCLIARSSNFKTVLEPTLKVEAELLTVNLQVT
jgi:peroxiredoxin-like protein